MRGFEDSAYFDQSFQIMNQCHIVGTVERRKYYHHLGKCRGATVEVKHGGLVGITQKKIYSTLGRDSTLEAIQLNQTQYTSQPVNERDGGQNQSEGKDN